MNIKNIKRFLRNFKFEIYSILLAVFIFMTLIGIAKLWSYMDVGIFAIILNAIGYWWMWSIFIGALGIIGDGWAFGDYLYKRLEFDNMINTLGKAQFIKKLNEIEELSWDLTERDEEIVALKKEEFKIR
ncbi:MAG: DUF3198 domain-containing protein [Candidatus Thermoplasmatota archaeon]|jgi:hypothetical protein|nr:DUF3198 domain-containing protein [Candidatus Thermoplasmatota archaeon]MCL5963043.1 DUF3198 domain-containing protein [Candidatus Thermoplasmatota archaeon]